MTYSLKRTRDGAGDSGSMSKAMRIKEDNSLETIENSKPLVGYSMCVGSHTARSYQVYDYWTTTYVTEILEESEDYVRFKTGNSEYEWNEF